MEPCNAEFDGAGSLPSLGDSDRTPIEDSRAGRSQMPNTVNDLLTTPLRAGRHLAIWLVWHSTGVSLLPRSERR
jgi:hypothetical protein